MKNCKNILITGGAGFIGAHFLNQMVPKNSDTNFINIDILSYASDLNRLKKIDSLPNYKFYQVDICDKEKIQWKRLTRSIRFTILSTLAPLRSRTFAQHFVSKFCG